MKRIIFIFIGLILMLIVSACSKSDNSLVVYTSVDQGVAEEVFKDFTKKTGIKVKPVFDLEANKTTGLTNRIMSEKKHPQCDVFWNNEFIQTIKLEKEGLLDNYVSENSLDIPDKFKSSDGYWSAFGLRARVLLVNKELVKKEDYPTSFFDLINEKYNSKNIALAYPFFGTTKTHVAALYAKLGREKAREIFQKIAKSDVQIVDGNSVARDMVVAGLVDFAYTDTDDAKVATLAGENVEIIYPDLESMGTLFCPSTVSIIKGSKNQDNAKKFYDFLLSAEVENNLVEKGFFVASLRDENSWEFKPMDLSLYEIYEHMDEASADMTQIFGVAK